MTRKQQPLKTMSEETETEIQNGGDSCAAPCSAREDTHGSMRARQNAKEKVKRANRVADGICRCGDRAEDGVKMCKRCLCAARKASRDAYRNRKGIPLNAALSRRGRKAKVKEPSRKCRKPQTSLAKGVTRQVNVDGYGREDACYVAAIMVKGKQKARRWSINKHGEAGAKLAASLQKLLWVVEHGIWNPEDGDPLAILGYADSFSGNRDYDDCEIDDVSSPWIQEYED